MIEEPENTNGEETPDEAADTGDTGAGPDESPSTAPAEDAGQEAAEEAPAEEGPAEEAPAEDAPAEDAPAEEAAAEEPAAEDAAADAEEGEEGEPEELGPKQRRKRERSQHTGDARPARSPEERKQERLARRRARAESRRRWRARRRERRGPATGAEEQAPVEREHGRPRVRQGLVVSDRADKTITVRIEMKRSHRTYGKVVRSSSTLHAHDERNEANTGDTVRIVESRPLSRTKRWRLVEVLERAR